MKNILFIICVFATIFASAQNQLSDYSSSSIPSSGSPTGLVNGHLAAPTGVSFFVTRTDFNEAAPGLPIEGFENANISVNAIAGISSPLNANTNNSYFSVGDILPGISISCSDINHTADGLAVAGAGFAGNTSKIVVANYFTDSEIITFNPPITSVGLDVIEIMGGSSCTINIYNASSALIASTTSASSATGVFFGVTSSTPIGSIQIFSTSAGAEGADNIAFGSPNVVPVSNWAIYLVFFIFAATILLRFRKKILHKTA